MVHVIIHIQRCSEWENELTIEWPIKMKIKTEMKKKWYISAVAVLASRPHLDYSKQSRCQLGSDCVQRFTQC